MTQRLIDANALHKLFGAVTTDLLSKPELSKDFEHMVRAFIMTTKMIEDQPTIDAVPVIRCKDCKNNPSTLIGWIECPMTGAGTRQPNDFCSYAKPKETE